MCFSENLGGKGEGKKLSMCAWETLKSRFSRGNEPPLSSINETLTVIILYNMKVKGKLVWHNLMRSQKKLRHSIMSIPKISCSLVPAIEQTIRKPFNIDLSHKCTHTHTHTHTHKSEMTKM